MRKVEKQIVINANVYRVWGVLTDFESYPEWNPFIRSITGKAQKGEQLKVDLAMGNDPKTMQFKPLVLKSEPGQEFRWKGKLWVKGLFDGEHYFILKPLGENQTQFIHGESFSGLLVGLLQNTLKQVPAGFTAMNEALKERVERKSA